MPVYNEEGAIRDVIDKWTKEFFRLGIDFQIHAYNDGSRDNTLCILNHLASENNNVIVHDKLNSGHGPTIIQGYRENSNTEWLFQIDSDDEIGAESFGDLWVNRNRFQFLIGKRIRPQQPLTRKLISSISRIIVELLYGNKVYDVNSPYRLMKTEALKKIFFSLPDNMFAPNVVIAGAVSLSRLRCYEIPVQQRERVTGEVSIKKMKLLKAVLQSFYQTITYRFKMKKNVLF
jgi:glycosyltransferase involved in cell wall biosynthesis